MRALTVRQPYASLLVKGFKLFETRGWATPYRGPVAIHAAKRWSKLSPGAMESIQLLTGWTPAEMKALPRGAFVGVVDLDEVHESDSQPVLEAFQDRPFESAIGDYGPGRYAWETSNPREIEPVAATGQLGFWTVDESTLTHGSDPEDEKQLDLGLA